MLKFTTKIHQEPLNTPAAAGAPTRPRGGCVGLFFCPLSRVLKTCPGSGCSAGEEVEGESVGEATLKHAQQHVRRSKHSCTRRWGDAQFVHASNLTVHFKLGFVSFQALLKFQLLLQLHALLRSFLSLPQVLQAQKKHPGSWLKGGERPDWRGRERSRSASKERRRKGDKLVLAQRDAARSSFSKIYTMSRQRQDALERRRAEEQARQEAEAQRLLEEKRRRDEEEQRRAEEERAQAVMEAALLQKQVDHSCSNLPPSLSDNQGGNSLPVCFLPVSAWGGTGQREGQSRAAETRARVTGAEGGRGTAGQKEGEVGKYLT